MRLLLLLLILVANVFGQFTIHKELKTWHEALEECRKKGKTLAKVRSAFENTFINSLRSSSGTYGVRLWMGANDLGQEGKFRWTDGTLLSDGYTNWNVGEPNDQNGEDCAHFRSNNQNWNDVPCTLRYGYVCGPKSAGDTQGDPVVKTFDGYEYEYQGLCSYVLSMDCNLNYQVPQKNMNNFKQFKLIGTNKPCDLGTCLHKVTLLLKKTSTQNIRVQFFGDKVSVNGKKLRLSGKKEYSYEKLFKVSNYNKKIDENDSKTSTVDVSLLTMHALNKTKNVEYEKVIRLETNFGLIIDWNELTSKISVTMDSYDHSVHKTCGLMGNLDNNMNNDLRFPDGTVLEDLPSHFDNELEESWVTQTFVHHWLDKQPGDPQKCKSSTPRKLCNGDHKREEYASKMCNRIVKTLDVNEADFKSLSSKCLHDMCFCYNDDIFQCAAFIFKSLSKSLI